MEEENKNIETPTEEVQEQTNNIEPNKNNKSTILIILILVILIGVGVWFLVANPFAKDNKESNNQNNQENKDKNEPAKNDFDFASMEVKLKELLNTNKEQIVLCNSMGNTPSAVYNTLANAKKDSISLIINKLKEASSYEEATFSFMGCSKNNISYVIGNGIYDGEFSLYYGDGEKVLLIGYDNKGYAFRYDNTNDINGFIESLKVDDISEDQVYNWALLNKLETIGLTSLSISYSDSAFSTCSPTDYWYTLDKLTVDNMSKTQLIQTAINNLDMTKLTPREGGYTGTYSLNEINEALSKVVYGKTLTIDDIIKDKEIVEIKEINGNDVTVFIYGEKECYGPYFTYFKPIKTSITNDKVDINMKVAFCEDDAIDNYPSDSVTCYKDRNKQSMVEKNSFEKSWDNYNTYKVTFKKIDGQYYFDGYELVK